MVKIGLGRLGAKRIPKCVGKKVGVFIISKMARAVKELNVNISTLKITIPTIGTQVAVRVPVVASAIGR